MDAHSLAVLEFPSVLACLAREAACVLGEQRAAALLPSADGALAAERLDETTEGRELLRQGPVAGLERARDIRGALSRAAIAGVRLPAAELLAVADTLEAAADARRAVRDARAALPRLLRLAERLAALPELTREIRRCLTADGTLVDTASPALARLRAEAREAREQVRGLLHGLLFAQRLQSVIAEPLITLRNERYVIPVTPGYRSLLPGIVQDQSASGHTLFLEPLQAVELNNEVRGLEREAEVEADRILGELTRAVGEHAGPIARTVEGLADLDLVLAKARLAERWDAAAPRLAEGGVLRLLGVRHPLLLEARKGRPEAVVPIDVALPRDVRVVAITGPNTGGKTVALKTVGLAAACAQAGLHIPAGADSELPVFRAVFAEIGDEQNIAQDLSTFSAHLRGLRTILEQAGGHDLVLVDELGAATDPGEGAALGSAVLEALAARGTHCLATTHLDGIKAFVAQNPRMINAAVEFDLDRMAPGYRLHLGLPGRSYAIEIACRLGIPPTIIQRARDLVGHASAGLDALLARLQSLEGERARDAAQAAADRAAARGLRQAAEERAVELQREVLSVRARASRLVSDIVRDTRRRAEAIMAELKRGAATREARAAIRELPGVGQARLDELPAVEAPPPARGLDSVAPGQEVRILHLGHVGTVIAVVDGQVEVQLPLGKTRVPIEQLAPAAPRAQRPASASVSWTAGAGDALSAEINVIGCTVEEGTARVQRYLDDAALGGLGRVRIIHGKGTGRLRQGIATLLKSHPLVAGFQLASFEEGGAGATVVDLGGSGEAAAPARTPDAGASQGAE
jgi:DNA mismatch repair protein MutS2